MEQQILDEILKDTYTLETFKKRFQALKRKLESALFESKEKIESLNAQDDWAQRFDKELFSQITSSSFTSISQYIDKYLSGLNILSIYFVFMPDPDQAKEIGEWIRKALGDPGIIFDAKVDPALIGGCALVYKGIYKDLSLRARIFEKKEVLLGEFKKYFKQ